MDSEPGRKEAGTPSPSTSSRRRVPTPKPRTVSSRKRSPSETEAPKSSSGGIWATITGRRQIERFQKDRYKPYGYETNRTAIRWLTLFLIITIALFAVSARCNQDNAQLYSSWQEQGLNSLPPRISGEAQLSDIVQSLEVFNERNGLDCNIAEAVEAELSFDPSEPCGRVLGYWTSFMSSRDGVDVVFFFIIPAVVALAFAIGSFTYRASRNLLALGSKDQRFRSDLAVLWLFIPIVNFLNPYRVFAEMFKASDPTVSESKNSTRWKQEGLAPPIIILWQSLLAVVVVLNPITVYRIFGPFALAGNQIEQITSQSWLAFSADVLMIAFAVVTLVMVFALYLRQERKHLIVGQIVVQPPVPRDPLEVAVEKAEETQTGKRERKG